MEQLLHEKQVAELLGCSVQLLRKWRGKNEGPQHIKIGRCVRYTVDDVRSFVGTMRQQPNASGPRTGVKERTQ